MDWLKIDNSPSALRSFLDAEGLAPKKRFGQNFMISPGARQSVLDALEAEAADRVWEVGPGLGAITSMLVASAGQVVVFEIDHGVMDVLRRRFGEAITIVAGDAVKTLKSAGDGAEALLPDLAVGNLPYRSASAIVAVLLEHDAIAARARRMAFTVQKEMALRMVAAPGQKDYSPLSVLCQLSGAVALVGDMAGGSFYPVPEVVSSLVTIVPTPVNRKHLRAASRTARALFTSRRKTIRNNLGTLASSLGLPREQLADLLSETGVDLSLRAEAIDPGKYLELGEVISAAER